MCYDDSRKRTLAEKITDAIERYRTRFGAAPTLVWVSPGAPQDLAIADVTIECRPTIPPNTIWVGMQPAAAP